MEHLHGWMKQDHRSSENAPWSAELTLLLATIRWPAPLELVRSLAGPDLDWQEFLALGARHRVLGLVAHAIDAAGVEPPPQVAARLRSEASRIRLEEIGYAAEAQRLQKLLAEAGVASFVLKGVINANLAFGKLGLRVNRDLDLLVDLAAVGSAVTVLEAQGYQRVEPAAAASAAEVARWCASHKDMVFIHATTARILELHWRLFDNPYYFPVPDHLTATRYNLEHDISVTGLDADFTLIYLCVHGSQHAWSRLKWLADIAPILGRLSADQFLKLYDLSRRSRVDRSFKQGVFLCERLLGLEIPAAAKSQMRRSTLDNLLEFVAVQAIVGSGSREIEDQRFGTTQKNISHYLLGRGVRYRLAEAVFDANDYSLEGRAQGWRFAGPLARPLLWAHAQLSKFRG